MTHLYQLCHNARRGDQHSEAELWARFKAVRPQDACAVTPARPAMHPTPEQIDAALEWARKYLGHRKDTPFPELVSQDDTGGGARMLGFVTIAAALLYVSLGLWWWVN